MKKISTAEELECNEVGHAIFQLLDLCKYSDRVLLFKNSFSVVRYQGRIDGIQGANIRNIGW